MDRRRARVYRPDVSVPKSPNIRREAGLVTREERAASLGHRGATLWLTGLPGSGKSTIAYALERALVARRCGAYVLDGDNVRHGLSSDLGFSPEERREHLRRVGEVARLFTDAGVIALCAFVSPYRAERERIRASMPAGDFLEVHVRASLEVCEQRDPKGLYGKARAGEIDDLTGVGAPYEPPLTPELVLDTEHATIAENVADALAYLEREGYVPRA